MAMVTCGVAALGASALFLMALRAFGAVVDAGGCVFVLRGGDQ